MNDQANPLPYELAGPNRYHWTQLAYVALNDGTLTVTFDGSDDARRVTLGGPCPRCKHEVNFDQLLDAVAGEDGELKTLGNSTAELAPTYIELVVSCRCGEVHSGRPDGVSSGCGINFRADVLPS